MMACGFIVRTLDRLLNPRQFKGRRSSPWERMANPNDEDMPAEIDFSKGARGKFFKPGTAINLPVYLDAEVQAYFAARQGSRCRGRSARQ
jgi:hypothetical protein